ncbi:hypothetical protein [Sphingomonas oligoaromativorans]|uniref:hypothetical protein n=1 Tax=Sphingomonas oligoaromativorans TaxID=575322 RepID=UPI001421E26E|nr:hypothetical protein [Sphingomonas oligoaromativorans]NIJ31889.1 hypothetical protein [Sphingomonas oligoaromativorans]
MTSISGNSWGSGIQALLQKQVTAGTIPSGDQSALSSAIGDIGKAIQSAGTSAGSMKDQVSSAIDNEVSTGKLTTDQATELKGLFAKAHAGHAHHAHGGGGASALDSLFSDDGTDPTSTASSTTSTDPFATVAGDANSAVDRLSSFVSSLRSAVSSNSLYGAAGSTAGRLGSMLVNSFA